MFTLIYCIYYISFNKIIKQIFLFQEFSSLQELFRFVFYVWVSVITCYVIMISIYESIYVFKYVSKIYIEFVLFFEQININPMNGTATFWCSLSLFPWPFSYGLNKECPLGNVCVCVGEWWCTAHQGV